MMETQRLIYIFDPFCSWCYAMSPEIMRTYDAFSGQINFGFITGGMMIGDQGRAIGDKKEYLKTVRENIEALFGKNAQENAAIDYQKARKFGITGFPTLLYQQNDRYGIVSAGYRDYYFLEKITTRLINNPAEILKELQNE